VAAAAAVIAANQRRAFDNLLFAFRQGDATAPPRARSLADLGVTQSSLLTGLQRAAVIVPGAQLGTFYLDERALHTYRSTKQKRAAIVAALVGVAFLLVGAVLFFLTARTPTSH
jgi:hypothetical protein